VWFVSSATEDLGRPPNPLRVLVVEDQKESLDCLAILLRMHGYEVEVAQTGFAAVALAPTWLPHVVLLDLKLSDMHGYEVAERLHADPRVGNVPLIAVTGYASPADFRLSAAAGMALHLVKPVDPKELLAVLDDIQSRTRPRPVDAAPD
jgi:CheY-like chemotaxis protein